MFLTLSVFALSYSYFRLGGSNGLNQNGVSGSLSYNPNRWLAFRCCLPIVLVAVWISACFRTWPSAPRWITSASTPGSHTNCDRISAGFVVHF